MNRYHSSANKEVSRVTSGRRVHMVILPSAPMSPLCEYVTHFVLELGIL